MPHHLIDSNIQQRFVIANISKQIHDSQYEMLEQLVKISGCSNMQTLEIGSWTGLSAVIIGEVVQRMKGTHYCVDWFKGTSDNDGYLQETSQKYNIKERFLNNIKYFELDDTIKLIEMKSNEAVKLFDNDSLDFIFIDGDHSELGVMQDITLWLPKLKIKKYMCGHDYLACKPVVDKIFTIREIHNDIWYIKKGN